MSVLHNNPFLLASGSPTDPTFPVQRSVRLRSSASAYFARTPASAGNRQIFTFSFWIKRGALSASQEIYFVNSGSGNFAQISWSATNTITIASVDSSVAIAELITSAVYRDPSAWYHLVFSVDTTQATASNRVKVYVNGVQVTVFNTATYPSLNYNFQLNNTTSQNIGRPSTGTLDGYLTEFNFIDGQALTPSSFGSYNSGTGVWEPRKYTGTYGTNGFYLNFQDNSGATATTIGKDSSGNANNWTPNNISVTAGVTYDSMLDVPTNTSPTNANYCTLNPLNAGGVASSANLNHTGSGANWYSISSTIPFDASGNSYAEVTILSNNVVSNGIQLGIIGSAQALSGNTATLGSYATGYAWQSYVSGGSTNKFNNGTGGNYNSLATYTTGDVIGISLNNGTLTFYKNGVSQGSAYTGLSGTFCFADAVYNGDSIAWNFGQRPFAYTPPTGFVALNTYNLPDPTIASGDDYHKVYTYTGNGGGLQVGEIQKPASLFNLDRSLRFRKSNSAYFNRTFSTPTSGTTWTWSGWVKRGALDGADQFLLSRYQDANNISFIRWNDTNVIRFYDYSGGVLRTERSTTAVYRDCNLWYHIVVAYDSGNATPANRVKIYVNGVEIAAFSSSTNPTQNQTSILNSSGAHQLGAYNTTNYFDGYLADVYLIDGQALTPTDFGAYDGNYYWTPKAYTGTYGTNGFHLEFEDFSNNTATTIGKDTSGQGNNWTPTGINVTVPANTNASWDSMTDVPTLTSADVANFATLNPLDVSGVTLSDGNLALTTASGRVRGTIFPSSGKWYFEVLFSALPSTTSVGIANVTYRINTSNDFQSRAYLNTGSKISNGTSAAYGATWTTNDVIGVAYDIDAGTITFYKNNTSQGTAYTDIAGDSWSPFIQGGFTGTINFGQRPFRYTPPTGFKALNSFNVAEVTGDLESPDFVWIKSRSASGDHALFNSVTGVGKYLRSNASGAEITDVNSLIQFNKNGFLLGNATVVNASATTFVASAWKAAATTVTNTAGTITTQVRASPTAGISVVTYTGTLAGSTIGHGLGAAPRMVIIKNQGTIGTQEWLVGHASIGWGSYLLLSSTNLRVVASNRWNNTDPTSTVITLGSIPNSNTEKYVAYCFAEINGFSKFGSYLSNNATDGPFVYTGFRPRWLMVKRAIAASGTGGWFMYDAERNTYNVMDQYMFAESTSGDATLAVFDFTSNGFKIRSNNVHVNTTAGDTYIYMAFAEHPFKYALAR
jgi:hypothetical protein